jgi:molecular chaperone DnaK
VTGEQLPVMLPAQSEIELTLSIDASRRASLSIYIPALDETIDTQFESTIQKTEDVVDLMSDVEQAREVAEKIESGEGSLDVSVFKSELNEVERLLNNRGNDVDVKVLARQKLQKTFIALDKIEATNKWPELEAKLDAAMARLLANDQRYGDEKSQQLVKDYLNRLHHAKSENNYNVGLQLLDEIYSLSFAFRSQDIDLWISIIKNYDQEFETTEWTEKNEARRVLNDAKNLIDGNPSKSSVEVAVRTLWSLMPKEKRDAAKRASDDILRQ